MLIVEDSVHMASDIVGEFKVRVKGIETLLCRIPCACNLLLKLNSFAECEGKSI